MTALHSLAHRLPTCCRLQDRVLPDGTFIPAGSLHSQSTVEVQRHEVEPQRTIRLRQPGRSSQTAAEPASDSLRNIEPTSGRPTPPTAMLLLPSVHWLAAPLGLGQFCAGSAAAERATYAEPTPPQKPSEGRRQPGVPPTAPAMDPISQHDLERLVDFLQDHRHGQGHVTAVTAARARVWRTRLQLQCK